MKKAGPNPAKELYHQLRLLPWEELWTKQVPEFDNAAPDQRIERVALIRAVGVVFSETGRAEDREHVKAWLRQLLNDPAEKIRRYAIAAIPKIGADPSDEVELLSLLKTTACERERRYVGQTLDKIGGEATLKSMEQGSDGFLLQTQQKVKAAVARTHSPGAVRLDRVLSDFAGLQIHLRGRRGLEQIVRDEVVASRKTKDPFRICSVSRGLVALTPIAPFSLDDIFSLRCFDTLGLVIGIMRQSKESGLIESLAASITSPLSRHVLKTLTDGAIRYRLDFVSKGHQRATVREVANRAYALCPEILNDARNAPWTVAIHTEGQKLSVELCPKLVPDPRYSYRQHDVPAASHPPLAACMARLAGKMADEVIWDPFCGSGIELIERSLLGGVRFVYGSDRSAAAIDITRKNFAAANLQSIQSKFACCDFRDYSTIEGLGPNTVTLIITNPPLGRRVPISNLRGLIEGLFHVAEVVLKPAGRLVFVNPLRIRPTRSSLRQLSSQSVDLGGFDCRLETYRKIERFK